MIPLVVLFWLSLGLLVWTHVGYPFAAAVGARLRPRRVRKGDKTPSVSLIVAAHNEDDVIERRLERAGGVRSCIPTNLPIPHAAAPD